MHQHFTVSVFIKPCVIENSIALAKEDLLNKYGINVYEAEKTDSTEEIVSEFETEDGFEQIALIDTILPVVLSQNKLAA